MAGSFDDQTDEKPLDPAVERVRRKLLRFVAINLGLLFAAVIIVIAAVVYKSATSGTPPTSATDIRVPSGETIEADIPIPAGARIGSHTLSGNRVSLDLELPTSRHVILVYDLAERRVIARLAVTPQ
jgi:hypothetical protein